MPPASEGRLVQATQTSPASKNAVVVPTGRGDGVVVVAVRDGVAELSRAVHLSGSARRLFEEHGPSLSEEVLAAELLRDGAESEVRAAADARSFLDQLAASGLVPRDDGQAPGAQARGTAEPGSAVELCGADVERLARAVLANGLVLRYRALGRSMRPAIPHGSMLEVVPRAFSGVRRGEVALYSAGDGRRLVAHRVVRRREGRLLARGDSSTRLDEVDEAAYLGVVRARVAPDGARARVSSPLRGALGLATGALYRFAAFVARRLVVAPLGRTFGGRSIVRASLRWCLRILSGVLLWIGRVAHRARGPIDVARAALLSTAEKDADRRALYARRAVQRFTSLDENVAAGLTPIEELLLARQGIRPGKTLVLGCGPGRECLVLARRGHQVTGLDREEGMLERARELARKHGLSIRYEVGEALDFRVDGGPFDHVVVFSGLINMLLPRTRRIAMLACAHRHLVPGGRVLMTFLSSYAAPGSPEPAGARGFWGAVNPEHERGDLYLLNEAVHVFESADELRLEALEAGLEVEALFRDQRAYHRAEGRVRGYAVLRRPA